MKKIVLASTSPRRIDLLTQVGLPPKVIAPDVDETRHAGESPKTMVARLAREKAESVAARMLALGEAFVAKDIVLIIAADTIVVAPNGKTVLGKPINAAEAAKMLRMLVGKTHTVLTGYCILQLQAPARGTQGYRSHVLVRVVTSKVKMRALSRAGILRYVKTGEPMDKAGAYAAQGVGMTLIESLSGSYTNVVGLPICQLLADLESRFGVEPF